MKTYQGFISKLEPHQIFVFGSNPEGRHGKGAFPDVNGRKAWKTWEEIAEDMKKDLLEIADKSFDAGRNYEGGSNNDYPFVNPYPNKEQYLSELSGNTEQLKEKNV